jgi:hypothetical protein
MKTINIILTIFIALLLAACGTSTPPEPTPDVAAVRTSAASTVVSQFTLTAAAFTPTLPSSSPATEAPTLELEPTATATATVASITNEEGTPVELCDSLGYDLTTVDVNVPDNTVMNPGQDFIKTWKVKNTGSCPWGAGYVLDYGGYENEMDGQFIALTEVIQPGQEVDVSVQFKAPDEAGIYVSAWTMENPQGVPFPEIVFVKIIVQ